MYYLQYKEIPGKRNCTPFLWPLSQLSSLSIDLPDYISKFTSYHLHHKEKSEITKSVYNFFFLRPPHKLLLLSTFFDYISKFSIYHSYYKKKLDINNLTQNFAYGAEPSLVTKKKKLPKTSLYFFRRFLTSVSHNQLDALKNTLVNLQILSNI